LLVIAAIALLVCFYLGFGASGDASSAGKFKSAIVWPTLIYFIAATALVFVHKDKTSDAN